MSVNITANQSQHKYKCGRCGTSSYETSLEYQEQGKCSSCISLSDEEAKDKKNNGSEEEICKECGLVVNTKNGSYCKTCGRINSN